MEQPGAQGHALAAQEIDGLFVLVEPAAGEKCVRCWFTLRGGGGARTSPGLSPLPASIGGVMSRKIVLLAILVMGVGLDQVTKYWWCGNWPWEAIFR